MVKLRLEEAWAAACIEEALPEVEVRQFDNNVGAAMHDLDLYRDGSLEGACEVTAAADRHSIELWKLVNGNGRHIEKDLDGGWGLTLEMSCRWKELEPALKPFLRDLELRGVTRIGEFDDAPDVREAASRLGIHHGMQSNTAYPGSVYFSINLPSVRQSGAVPDTGDELSKWLAEWVNRPERDGKIRKVVESDRKEKHLFVILPGFSEAPFAAMDVLMWDDGPLPVSDPQLPKGLTHLWAVSDWSTGDVFMWSKESGWTRSAKVFEVPARLVT